MRLHSLAFRKMASPWAASFGDMSRSTASSASSVLAPCRLPKVVATRVSIWPAFSIATMVLSNVAGFGLLAMASTSFRWMRMPSSNAGAKSQSLIWSNAGELNGSVLALKKGFDANDAAVAAAAGADADDAAAACATLAIWVSARPRLSASTSILGRDIWDLSQYAEGMRTRVAPHGSDKS